MFSYYLTKIGIPWVSISVVDLEIAIKESVCYNFFSCVYPENRQRSSLGCCVSEGEPTKEFSQDGTNSKDRRRSPFGWVMFVLLSVIA